MKIAILGAGFAGLATAWMLLKHAPLNTSLQITIFDKDGIAKGASGVAAGLLHPFANVHSKLNRFGLDAFEESISLLNTAEIALEKSIADRTGILRQVTFKAQYDDYKKAATEYVSEIEWLEIENVLNILPKAVLSPGIFIKRGLVVHPESYLKGLWLACQQLGARFEKAEINALSELSQYDLTVTALGAGTALLPELSHLPLRYTKGQILELEWPEGLPPLPFAVNASLYAVMLQDKKRCLVGSTYERGFASTEVDQANAEAEILPKLEALYPPLAEAKILDCRAGIRVSTPQHLPLCKKIDDRSFVITGFGSKGLLYHAYYAKKLALEIFSR